MLCSHGKYSRQSGNECLLFSLCVAPSWAKTIRVICVHPRSPPHPSSAFASVQCTAAVWFQRVLTYLSLILAVSECCHFTAAQRLPRGFCCILAHALPGVGSFCSCGAHRHHQLPVISSTFKIHLSFNYLRMVIHSVPHCPRKIACYCFTIYRR